MGPLKRAERIKASVDSLVAQFIEKENILKEKLSPYEKHIITVFRAGNRKSSGAIKLIVGWYDDDDKF